MDWEEEEDRAWADWCLGVLGGGALLGDCCRVSGEGRRRKAEFRCGREHKSPGISASLPPLQAHSTTLQGLRRGAAPEEEGSRDEW